MAMTELTTNTVAAIPSPVPELASASTEQPASIEHRPRPRGPPLHQIYALPAPIRTFPLPSFYPNNPISLFHLVYTWVRQVLSPPPNEPTTIYKGSWDADTRSVHVKDPMTVRALWEQGFYGKGSLSRSEPNWLKREQIRRGVVQGDVSEERTASRREERRQVKWERARTEQEALERTRREEAQLTSNGSETPYPAPSGSPVLEQQPQVLPPLPNQLIASRSQNSIPSVEVSAGTMVVPVRLGPRIPNGASSTDCLAEPPSHPADKPGTVLCGLTSEHEAPGTMATVPLVDLASSAQPASESVGPLIRFSPSKPPVGPLELLHLPNSLPSPRLTQAPVSQPRDIFPDEVIHTPTVRSPRVSSGPDTGHGETRLCLLKPPVGPLELLALPNSQAEVLEQVACPSESCGAPVLIVSSMSRATGSETLPRRVSTSRAPLGPLKILALPNSLAHSPENKLSSEVNDSAINASGVVSRSDHIGQDPKMKAGSLTHLALPNGHSHPSNDGKCEKTLLNGYANGSAHGVPLASSVVAQSAASTAHRDGAGGIEKGSLKRTKSVRFSAEVESTSFLSFDRPSPSRVAVTATLNNAPVAQADPVARTAASAAEISGADGIDGTRHSSPTTKSTENALGLEAMLAITNQEHLQLAPEEAFFLAFALGALSVLDPTTQKPLCQEDLLALFRSHSSFPPAVDLQPYDPFLIHYVVYHHFRSLGWVPRHGVKFGVDWMLYQRGPVFDHAEFGIIVVPAFTDPWWKEHGREPPPKSWHWLHGLNRVLSHVLKSLVLVYVDVPPPPVFDSAMTASGVSAALEKYRVREFMFRRWSINRNR